MPRSPLEPVVSLSKRRQKEEWEKEKKKVRHTSFARRRGDHFPSKHSPATASDLFRSRATQFNAPEKREIGEREREREREKERERERG